MPETPDKVARLTRMTQHIIALNGLESLCGIISLRWWYGFQWDERIACKKCLAKWKGNCDAQDE